MGICGGRKSEGTAMLKQSRIIILFLIIISVLSVTAQAKEISDIYGRKFTISDHPRKVFSTSPPVTHLLYAIDPTMLAGLNFPVREREKRFMHPWVLKLPIVGGWFGQGQTPNMEMLLKVDPEIVLITKYNSALSEKIDQAMKPVRKPVINVPLENLKEYPETFLRVGKILGRESRAKRLSDYGQRTLKEAERFAAKVPQNRKTTVYYAEGPDGLSTECDTSQHAELINLAGGKNVHHCKSGNLYGMEKVSMEQVYLYNPEVILVMDRGFYQQIYKDQKWSPVRAVKNGRVHLIPDEPLNWFDRPPSFMRFIGLKWVMNLLYPNECRIDMVKEAREFYRLFLGVEVSEQEMRTVIHR
jgi:iron complex transport system substrate-binding protein